MTLWMACAVFVGSTYSAACQSYDYTANYLVSKSRVQSQTTIEGKKAQYSSSLTLRAGCKFDYALSIRIRTVGQDLYSSFSALDVDPGRVSVVNYTFPKVANANYSLKIGSISSFTQKVESVFDGRRGGHKTQTASDLYVALPFRKKEDAEAFRKALLHALVLCDVPMDDPFK